MKNPPGQQALLNPARSYTFIHTSEYYITSLGPGLILSSTLVVPSVWLIALSISSWS